MISKSWTELLVKIIYFRILILIYWYDSYFSKILCFDPTTISEQHIYNCFSKLSLILVIFISVSSLCPVLCLPLLIASVCCDVIWQVRFIWISSSGKHLGIDWTMRFQKSKRALSIYFHPAHAHARARVCTHTHTNYVDLSSLTFSTSVFPMLLFIIKKTLVLMYFDIRTIIV